MYVGSVYIDVCDTSASGFHMSVRLFVFIFFRRCFLFRSMEQIAIVKSLAHKSGVGQGTETVINSQIRRSWELHPAQIKVNFAVKAESKETTHSESQTCKKSKKVTVQRGRTTESREGAESAIESIISTIKRELEVGDWEVSAEFYKMLVYEPGCFFRRHP